MNPFETLKTHLQEAIPITDEITLNTRLDDLSEPSLYQENEYETNDHQDVEAIYYQKFRRHRLFTKSDSMKKIYKSKDEVYLVQTVTNDKVTNYDWVGENEDIFSIFVENFYSFSYKLSFVFAILSFIFISIAMEEISIYTIFAGVLGFFLIYPFLMLLYLFLEVVLIIAKLIGYVIAQIYYYFVPEKMPVSIIGYSREISEKEFENLVIRLAKKKILEDDSIIETKYSQNYKLDDVVKNGDIWSLFVRVPFTLTLVKGKKILQEKRTVTMNFTIPLAVLEAHCPIENKINKSTLQSVYVKKSRFF